MANQRKSLREILGEIRQRRLQLHTQDKPTDTSDKKTADESSDGSQGLPIGALSSYPPQSPDTCEEAEDKTMKWHKDRKFVLELLAFLVLVAYTIFSGFMWWHVRWTNAMLREQLDGSSSSLQQTLDRMVWQIQETHEIAKQTLTEATQTGRLVTQTTRAANAAMIAADTERRALEVQNRPWMSAEVAKADDPINSGELRFDRDGNLSVTLMVKGNNFGKSIAQDVRIYSKLFASRVGDPFVEIRKRQNELCDRPKILYVRPGIPFFQGFDRFPDQTYEQGSGIEIAKEDVLRESLYYADDPLRRRFISRLYLVGRKKEHR